MELKRREFIVRTAVLTSAGSFGVVPMQVMAQGRGNSHIIANTEPEPPSITTYGALNGLVIRGNLFDGLVDYDKNFKLVPRLAKSWEQSADGLSITFRLRDDVRWHDGKPFTSADIPYSLEILRQTNALAKTTFTNVASVETPDPHTAIFRLSAPAPVIWSYLHGGLFRLIPRHLYEGTDIATNPRNSNPVGNGPYIFKEWVRGSHITLERNPDYWDKSRPFADKLTFRFVPDEGAREAALETGEIDYAAYSPVPLSSVKRLQRGKNLVVDTDGWKGVIMIFFFDFNLKKKAFQDVRVRQAFAHAIDRNALRNVVWYGLAKVAKGPVPSVREEFFNPNTPQYEFDPKKAEKLLDEAGLKRGADGVRLRINHVTHSLGGDEYRRAGDFFKQSLKAIGIELELVNYDTPTQIRKIFTDRDFDTTSMFYAANLDPQIGVIRRFWTKSIVAGVPWGNASQYSSPQTDKIIDTIITEGDAAKRRQAILDLQTITQKDLPSINLLETPIFRVYSRKLEQIGDGPWAAYNALSAIKK